MAKKFNSQRPVLQVLFVVDSGAALSGLEPQKLFQQELFQA